MHKTLSTEKVEIHKKSVLDLWPPCLQSDNKHQNMIWLVLIMTWQWCHQNYAAQNWSITTLYTQCVVGRSYIIYMLKIFQHVILSSCRLDTPPVALLYKRSYSRTLSWSADISWARMWASLAWKDREETWMKRRVIMRLYQHASWVIWSQGDRCECPKDALRTCQC